EGRLDLIGPASDVYSLGATLYYVLTGKPPIVEEEGDVAEMLRRVRRGEVPRPRQVNRAAGVALEATCVKALGLQPVDRYATPSALAAEIEHWLADEPVSVYREPIATRLTRWGRRHKTLAAGIGALLVTAVVALAISTALISREQTQTERQRIRA